MQAMVDTLLEELPPAIALELRRATEADWARIEAMYEVFEPKGACMGLPPRKEPEKWLATLRPYVNFIVEDKGQVVAHAALCPENSSGEVAVFVHQDYRKQHLGRRLLEALIAEARRMGLATVWGMTEWDNLPMLRLARSLGFVSGDDPREFYLALK
jgi:N-acetylglutamate synthase-like GNAT family acetyltransferase